MDFDKTLEALKRIQNNAKRKRGNLKVKFQFIKFSVSAKIKQFLKETQK